MRGELIFACALLFAANLSSADESISAQAEAAAQQGDFEEALQLFRQASLRDDSPILQCKIGWIYSSLKNLPLSHYYFELCASDDKLPNWAKKEAQKVTKQLTDAGFSEISLSSTISGSVSPSWFTEHEIVVLPATLWGPLGTHTVKDQYGVRHELKVSTAKTSATINIQRPQKVVAPTVAIPIREAPATLEKPKGPNKGNKLPIALIAGGGSALIAGAVFHRLAGKTRSQMQNGTAANYDRLASTFKRRRAVALSLYGVGAATASIGTYLLFKNKNQGEGLSIAPTSGGVVALVGWRQ